MIMEVVMLVLMTVTMVSKGDDDCGSNMMPDGDNDYNASDIGDGNDELIIV